MLSYNHDTMIAHSAPFIPTIVVLGFIQPFVPLPHHRPSLNQLSPDRYLLVGNLSYWTEVENLQNLMEESGGPVKEIQFCRNESGFFDGTARVVFHNIADAKKAMDALIQQERTLTTTWIEAGVPAPPPTPSVLVDNLPRSQLIAQDLVTFFEPAGHGLSATFHRSYGRLNGTAELHFGSSDEVLRAVRLFDGHLFKGLVIRVRAFRH